MDGSGLEVFFFVQMVTRLLHEGPKQLIRPNNTGSRNQDMSKNLFLITDF